MRLTDNSATAVPGGSPIYAWRINSYANQGNKRVLQLVQTGGAEVDRGTAETSCSTGCSTWGSGFSAGPAGQNGAVTIQRNTFEDDNDHDLLNQADATYEIGVYVTWTFTNGCQPLVAEYTVSGAGRGVPSVTKNQ